MNSITDIQNYLNLLYLDTNIPSYLYEKESVISSNPEQTDLTMPPRQYLRKLSCSFSHVTYCSTDYGIYYGCVRLSQFSDHRLVFGPVSKVSYSDAELHKLYIDYVIPQDAQEAFRSFLQFIPQMSLVAFLTKLVFINYCLNQEILSVQDFLPVDSLVADSCSFGTSNIIEKTFHQKEDFYHNKSYEIETLILTLIRTGNTDGIRMMSVNDSTIHMGVMGPTPLRELKNTMIITTTLATRAAIEGGLDCDTAYRLSDEFIQDTERLQSPDSLYELQAKIPYIFAEKVQEAQIPTSSNTAVQKAVRFIQQNTNQALTVADVAEYVGFSRSYFSTYFKQTLGFSISAFISRCKLEEGRRLLQYTNKSISVISSYLCFSNQSHFQTAFKKQFGVTPMQYRKDPKLPPAK